MENGVTRSLEMMSLALSTMPELHVTSLSMALPTRIKTGTSFREQGEHSRTVDDRGQ